MLDVSIQGMQIRTLPVHSWTDTGAVHAGVSTHNIPFY